MKKVVWLFLILWSVGLQAEEEVTLTGSAPEPGLLGSTTGNIALTSDYIWRGLSQTSHGPAIQAGMEWSNSLGFYVGAWGSNVDINYNDDNENAVHDFLEIDFTGGYKLALSEELAVSLGAQYYTFYNNGKFNMWEFPVKLEYNQITASAAFSPSWNGQPGQSLYLNVGYKDTFPQVFGVGVGVSVGYSIFEDKSGWEDYPDVRVGLSRELLGVEADVSVTFTDKRRWAGQDDTKVALTISKSL